MVRTYRVPPRFRVDRLIAEGDFVVAMGEITLKDDRGNDTHHSYCDVWRFHDGKMAALRAFVVDLDPKGPRKAK
jgi:ketosteroid isomerase-like protein